LFKAILEINSLVHFVIFPNKKQFYKSHYFQFGKINIILLSKDSSIHINLIFIVTISRALETLSLRLELYGAILK